MDILRQTTQPNDAQHCVMSLTDTHYTCRNRTSFSTLRTFNIVNYLFPIFYSDNQILQQLLLFLWNPNDCSTFS